jgi:hypothetical protein
MKALLLFLMACTASFAQNFTVTSTGSLVSKKDSKVDYVIANSPGISADSLYAGAKRYMQSKSGEAQVTLKSEDPGKVLIFETTDAPVTTVENTSPVAYTASYTTSIEFKEGKARITYGNIIMYTTGTNREKKDFPLTSVYNSKGKVVNQKAKNLVEGYFSANAKAIVAALKSDGKITSMEW